MNQNKVSTTLSDADATAVLAALTTVRQKLPFLVDLTPEDRRNLPKMGDKSRGFVSAALTVAMQNGDLLPHSFDVAEFQRDADLEAGSPARPYSRRAEPVGRAGGRHATRWWRWAATPTPPRWPCTAMPRPPGRVLAWKSVGCSGPTVCTQGRGSGSPICAG